MTSPFDRYRGLGAIRRASVLGAARSGIAAAQFLREQGISVFVSDICAEEKLNEALSSAGLADVEHEAGAHTERVLSCDRIVLSPGIPSDIPILQQATAKGIPVWSELELGYRASKAAFVAVTGSTGKSTTVSMAGEIVKAAGIPSVVAGNIGVPVIQLAPPVPANGVVVAEVSSFQLETIDVFKPKVAGIVNLMKNHLDRYPNEEAYYRAKMNIAHNLDKECWLVVNANDERLYAWAQNLPGRMGVVVFGKPDRRFGSVWYEQGRLVTTLTDRQTRLMSVADLKVAGRHNYDNASAAAAMALCLGIGSDAVAEGLRAFESLPHRLQLVAEHNGVRYYNDSKSTTAESVLAAVAAFGGRTVHLIAGGRDKGCDFSVVKSAVKDHAKEVLLIGEAAARIESEWSGLAPTVRCGSLEEAVSTAAKNAQAGDAVVMSPGCSSFDMFRNYEERGEVFAKLAREAGR